MYSFLKLPGRVKKDRDIYECTKCEKRMESRFKISSHIKRLHGVWGDTSPHIRDRDDRKRSLRGIIHYIIYNGDIGKNEILHCL